MVSSVTSVERRGDQNAAEMSLSSSSRPHKIVTLFSLTQNLRCFLPLPELCHLAVGTQFQSLEYYIEHVRLSLVIKYYLTWLDLNPETVSATNVSPIVSLLRPACITITDVFWNYNFFLFLPNITASSFFPVVTNVSPIVSLLTCITIADVFWNLQFFSYFYQTLQHLLSFLWCWAFYYDLCC